MTTTARPTEAQTARETDPRASVPRSEYPRPAFDRSHRWRTLNGTWDFRRGDDAEWSERITVPFAWESPASGIEAHWLERASYRRTFVVPAEWQDERVVMHFGAVHHAATVSVDGTKIGTHRGGSIPFEFDVTDALLPGAEHEVRVDVSAPSDKRGIVHGKQRSTPRDDYDSCAFTPSSGIWQPVWIEGRPATYLRTLALAANDTLDGIVVRGVVAGPSADSATAHVRIEELTPAGGVGTVSEAAVAEVSVAEVSVDAATLGAGVLVTIPEPRRWSPRDPHRYRVRVELVSDDGVDHVASATGLRSIETRGNRVFLNGERISLRGVLDQGYWPATGITAPDDAAFVRDLEIARDAGFTMVRKHLKLEDPRFYEHADAMGMLVWAEPASTGRFSPSAADAFADQIEPMVTALGNHPSIIVWGLYNEEWGLDWGLPDDPAKQDAVRDAHRRLKELDASRPVVDNSGWTHLDTDLVDWHVYDEHPAGWARKVAALVADDEPTFPVAVAVDVIVDKALMIGRPVPRDVPFLNSEFGGGWTSIDRGWNLHWQTQELRRHDDIAGWVWTELNDIEHESAGIVDTSRLRKDDGGRPPHHANGETATVFDLLPEAPGRDLVTADGRVRFGVAVSHHGAQPLDVEVTRGWGAVFGLEPSRDPASAGRVAVTPFMLSDAVTIEDQLPEGWTSGRLHVVLRVGGAVVGRGAVDVVRD